MKKIKRHLKELFNFLFPDYNEPDDPKYWDVDEEIYNDEITVKLF
jgi:hypothetical protein